MTRTPKLSTLVSVFAMAFAIVPSAALLAQSPGQAPDGFRGFRGPGGHGGPWGGPGEAPGPFMLERMADELDLTEAQLLEIEGVVTAHRDGTEELRAETHAAHEAIRELAESDVFDEAAIRAAGQRAADARIELAVERARLRSELHAMLTPEQQEKAAELKARRQERREFFRERRDERRGEGPARAPRGRRR